MNHLSSPLVEIFNKNGILGLVSPKDGNEDTIFSINLDTTTRLVYTLNGSDIEMIFESTCAHCAISSIISKVSLSNPNSIAALVATTHKYMKWYVKTFSGLEPAEGP